MSWGRKGPARLAAVGAAVFRLSSEGVTEEEEEEIGPFPPQLQGDICVPSPVTSSGCWPPTRSSLPSVDWSELCGGGLRGDTAGFTLSPAPEWGGRCREAALCLAATSCPLHPGEPELFGAEETFQAGFSCQRA